MGTGNRRNAKAGEGQWKAGENIFTAQKQVSVEAWGKCGSAAAGRTSSPQGCSLRHVACAIPWRAGSGSHSAGSPARLKEHWGSRAKPEPRMGWSGELRPTSRQRRRSARWQTPGIPCQTQPGFGQRPGWPKASAATADALRLKSYGSHTPLPSHFNRTFQASWGPKA
jgi:hypothetical protein